MKYLNRHFGLSKVLRYLEAHQANGDVVFVIRPSEKTVNITYGDTENDIFNLKQDVIAVLNNGVLSISHKETKEVFDTTEAIAQIKQHYKNEIKSVIIKNTNLFDDYLEI